MTATLLPGPSPASEADTARLLVTVRDPHPPLYRPVGFLTRDPAGYGFAYLEAEVRRHGFRPIVGLPETQPQTSQELFAVFADRVVSARRPERAQSLETLGLDADAGPFEVLTRSSGIRAADTIELLPAPRAGADGSLSLNFLTHGVRHLLANEQARITALQPHDPLRVQRDSANPANPHALIVTDTDAVRLGWVPDPLIAILDALQGIRASVVVANGPDVGFHFRLLVNIAGTLRPGEPQPFTGSEWAIHEAD